MLPAFVLRSPLALTSSRSTQLSTARCARRKPTMVVPQPDDAAVDMLAFALSGPGLAATGLFLATSAAALFSFAELGPRRRASSARPYYLRVSLPAARPAELPDGSTRVLQKGETILRFDSHEMCEAAARPLRGDGVSYSVYQVDGLAVRTLSLWPKEINVAGARWSDEMQQSLELGDDARDDFEVADPTAVWDMYERIGAVGELDKEWIKFRDRNLGGIMRVPKGDGECKLCGGTGFKRCYRCGGARPAKGSLFTCDCEDGRRPCEWCNTDGSRSK